MSTCGVDPTIASQLVQDGWTTQSFACAALDLESFDRLWQDLFSDTELSLLQKASVRAAFKMCQSALQSVAAPSAPSHASASTDPMTNQNSWAESFPPKLDSAVIDQLKSKFLASYPSELVNHGHHAKHPIAELSSPPAFEKAMGMDSVEIQVDYGQVR